MGDQDDLRPCNKTELIQLLDETHGIRAHRGMAKSALIDALVTGTAPKGTENPFDKERRLIMAFLKKHWEKIQSQLEIRCPADCWQHNDMQVLACYLSSREVLEDDSEGE